MNLTTPKLCFTPDNIHVEYVTKIAQEYNVIKTYLNTGKTQIININFQPHQLHQKYLTEFSGISLQLYQCSI